MTDLYLLRRYFGISAEDALDLPVWEEEVLLAGIKNDLKREDELHASALGV